MNELFLVLILNPLTSYFAFVRSTGFKHCLQILSILDETTVGLTVTGTKFLQVTKSLNNSVGLQTTCTVLFTGI